MKTALLVTLGLMCFGSVASAQYTPQQMMLYQQQQQQHQSHRMGFGNMLRGFGGGQNNGMSAYPVYGQPVYPTYGNQMGMMNPMQMGGPTPMANLIPINQMQPMQMNNPIMPMGMQNSLPMTMTNFGGGMSNIQTPSGPVNIMRSGNMEFVNGPNGFHETINRMGNTDFINGSNGYHETVQNMGNTSFYNGSGGNGTIQRMGNMDFINGSNGSGTLMHLGNTDVYNGTNGAHYTVNRLGNMTTVNP